MNAMNIDANKYPWYERYVLSVNTIARCTGMSILEVVQGLDKKINAFASSKQQKTQHQKAA